MTQTENHYTDDPKQGFIALVTDLAAMSGPDGLTLREIRDRHALMPAAYAALIVSRHPRTTKEP